MSTNLDDLIKKYGGVVETAPTTPDIDAVIKKYGGTVEAAPVAKPPSMARGVEPTIEESMAAVPKVGMPSRMAVEPGISPATLELQKTGEEPIVSPQTIRRGLQILTRGPVVGSLTDLEAKPTTEAEKAETGIEKGLSNLAAGLTTPANISLLLTTAATGGIAPTISKLVALGFSHQMARQLVDRVPEAIAAMSRHDTEEIARLATEIIGTGGMVVGGTKFALKKGMAGGASKGTEMATPEDILSPEAPSKLTPQEQAAVAYADKAGIPVDLGQRLKNSVAEGTRALLTNVPGGAGIVSEARAKAASEISGGLKKTVAPMSQEEGAVGAGQRVQANLQERYQRLLKASNEAWNKLYAIADDPKFAVTIKTGETPLEEVKAIPQKGRASTTQRGGVSFGDTEFGDLIDAVIDVGYVKAKPKGHVGGEYDAYEETMTSPKTRLLVRKEGGLAPDEMRQALASVGWEFKDTSEMLHAIADAAAKRPSLQTTPEGKTFTGGEPIMETVQAPVDLSAVKRIIKPFYDQLSKSLPEAQRAASPGYQLMGHILEGPDTVSLRTANDNLSAIKELGRGTQAQQEVPWVASRGQALAKQVIPIYHQAVTKTVSALGREAFAQWRLGRELTTQYSKMERFQRPLVKETAEPKRVIDALTVDADGGYQRLVQLRRFSPDSMAVVARAAVDDIVEGATSAEGIFSPAKAATRWEKLGGRTKNLLFPNAEMRSTLDALFTLSRMQGRDANPSGTAKVGALLGMVSSFFGGVTTATAGVLTGHPTAALTGVTMMGTPILIASAARIAAKAMYDPVFGRKLQVFFSTRAGTPARIKALSDIKPGAEEAVKDLYSRQGFMSEKGAVALGGLQGELFVPALAEEGRPNQILEASGQWLSRKFADGTLEPGKWGLIGHSGTIQSVEDFGPMVYVNLRGVGGEKRLVPVVPGTSLQVTQYDRLPPEIIEKWKKPQAIQ